MLSKHTKKWAKTILLLMCIVIITGCLGQTLMTSFRENMTNFPKLNLNKKDKKSLDLPLNPSFDANTISDSESDLSQQPTNDLNQYVLKSSIVPPVCPKCPDVINTGSATKCPPCPPCARCPESPFTCKKVPDYNAMNHDPLNIVRPNITRQI